MKIFLSFFQSDQQHSIPAYSFWEYYIKNGIVEAGHSYIELPGADWAMGIVPKTEFAQNNWKLEIWEKTVSFLANNPADLFLSYLFPEQINIEAIRKIKSLGIPCVNFFCDNVRMFKKIPVEFSAFDLNWVPEYKAVKLYQKAGYPSINLPMPIWIEPALRVLQPENNDQVTFIGSKDIQRQLFFEKVVIKSPGLPLAIYGSGWGEEPQVQTTAPDYTFDRKLLYQVNFIKNSGVVPYIRKLKQRNISTTFSRALNSKISGTISFEKYNDLTAKSMITIGINQYASYDFPLDKPNTYSRLRDIEAPMLGACYLTEQTDGLENLYDIGNEIDVYSDSDNFIEKVNELQSDTQKRKRLKINGQKRALQDHSIEQSLKKLIQKLS